MKGFLCLEMSSDGHDPRVLIIHYRGAGVTTQISSSSSLHLIHNYTKRVKRNIHNLQQLIHSLYPTTLFLITLSFISREISGSPSLQLWPAAHHHLHLRDGRASAQQCHVAPPRLGGHPNCWPFTPATVQPWPWPHTTTFLQDQVQWKQKMDLHVRKHYK